MLIQGGNKVKQLFCDHFWYAYVHNDPVGHVDLLGLRDVKGFNPSKESLHDLNEGRSLTQEEIELYIASGGNPNLNFGNITVVDRMPTVREVRNAAEEYGIDISGLSDADIKQQIDDSAAMSLPGGKTYVPTDKNVNGRKTDNEVVALRIHEVEHQDQYSSLGAKAAYEELIKEAQMEPPEPDPYNTPGYLENDAQTIEKKANALLSNGWTTTSSNVHNSSTTQCSNN